MAFDPPPTPLRTPDGDTEWAIEASRGDADPFHQRALPSPLRPTVWIHEVQRPAVVLGSTQRLDVLDADSADSLGVEICRRRSGGGLVLVDPTTSLWIDVVIPTGHRLWDDDIGRAFHWFGEVWADALTHTLSPAPSTTAPDQPTNVVAVHRGAAVHPRWGRVFCFAGLGHGEVTVSGRKVVGLSQRRTRHGTRIQSLAVLQWDPTILETLTQPLERPADLPPLADLAIGLPDHISPPPTASLRDAVLARLPEA